MNPTPGGKMLGESKSSPREIQNYLGRISGPLLDRIDLHIEVPLVKFRKIAGDRTSETSAEIRAGAEPRVNVMTLNFALDGLAGKWTRKICGCCIAQHAAVPVPIFLTGAAVIVFLARWAFEAARPAKVSRTPPRRLVVGK